ncbi:hypothetical protein ACWFRF_15470 [Nocardia sp. NPDC055165]
MATTLQADSFNDINIVERSSLAEAAETGDNSLLLVSTQGIEVGRIIYLGTLSREGCERAVVSSVNADGVTLGLTANLKLDHAVNADVTAVLGDLIHFWRAANVDGSVPADGDFTVIATRSIDPDQTSSFYRDADGSSSYWYRYTYYNATSSDETLLQNSEPVRGDDYGHYASLSEIRSKAGLAEAVNLKDSDIDLHRRAAEREVNGALAASYSVPFSPVPGEVNTLTVELAASMLLVAAFGAIYEHRLKSARDAIKAYADRAATITDDEGNSLVESGAFSGYPDANAHRAFRMGDIF